MSHVVKTGTRIGVNASPEPFSNIGASLLEDLGVVGLVSYAVFHPVAAAIVAPLAVVWQESPRVACDASHILLYVCAYIG